MDEYRINIEKDEDYIKVVHTLARSRGITFEQMLECERNSYSKSVAIAEVEAKRQTDKKKMRDECVFFCYQDVDQDLSKYINGETLHGYYRIVKTDKCYEFTIMECDLDNEVWQNAVKTKKVMCFPLEVEMGKGSFSRVTPDKIYTS